MTQFATDIEEQSVSEIVKPPKQYAVILLNDDFTPRDFVVHILQNIFYMPESLAESVMLKIHHEGRGVCGVFSWDIAHSKKDQVDDETRKAGYPLRCIVEEVEGQ
ncbi:MAG: ATP-dependent Clp protease adaptor ClpS [Neisseriaceae bacterium]|nr:ATP-dependent Clp protease adaptor ClpS [Neisseriaceae bacterium]